MKEICNKAACTGCMACLNVCSHNAINVIADEEGFDRPHINEESCVDCGLCHKVCPINNYPDALEPLKVYSGWSADEVVRLSSSSGGAFTEIARPILEEGGVVFGCALDENLHAVHIYVESMEELSQRLRGSKYVQSRIGDSYSQVKKFLKQGRMVLFSGTPCQIAGLRNYLGRDYDNLITVDLICHGVPSPMIFEDYKKYISETQDMTISDVKFRCKKSSWIFYNMTVTGHVEKKASPSQYIGNYYSDPYIRGFLRDYFLRPSCHQCRFTNIKRCGDFTVADWWGYRNNSKEDMDYEKKGVSLILCNSHKAVEISKSMKMLWRERTVEEAKKTNLSLSRPFPVQNSRKDFWKDYHTTVFPEVVNKYMSPEKLPLSTIVRMNFRDSILRTILLKFIYKFERLMRKIGLYKLILHTY